MPKTLRGGFDHRQGLRVSFPIGMRPPIGKAVCKGCAPRSLNQEQGIMFNYSPKSSPASPARSITGQFIARATVHYPSWQRAEDAVRWLRGELQIKPTVKQAGEIFRVSAPLMKAARERLERHERSKRHANSSGGAPTLSDSVIDNIVREVGVERIWASIDRLTQPSLPFAVAAE
jgi:hypothetical protein